MKTVHGVEGMPSYYRARYYDSAAGRFTDEDPIRFRAGVNFYAYSVNNPMLYVDPYGLESGDLNKLVPGPNGETAKNVPCPDCLEKMFHELQREVQEMQQKAGKLGCVVVCSTIGFADDAAAGGLALWSKRIRTFLSGPSGKLIMKVAGVCGFAAAGIYCTTKCHLWDSPPAAPPSWGSPLPPGIMRFLPWPRYD